MATKGTNRRNVALIVLACVAVSIWLWILVRPDIRFWTVIVWASLCGASWGLLDARRSSRMIDGERDRKPLRDYSTALISAKNHLVCHRCLFLAQTFWFAHAVFTGLQPEVAKAGPVTPSDIASLVVLLGSELTLTYLNFWLVIRRRKLRANVQKIGG